MTDPQRRYVFPPLERRGLIVGLQGRQLVALGIGVMGAVGILFAAPGSAGTAVAVVVLFSAGAAACLPMAGRPPVAWLPIILGWTMRRSRGAVVDGVPGQGYSIGARQRSHPPDAAMRKGRPGRAGRRRRSMMTAPDGLGLVAAPRDPGDPPMGVIADRSAGTLAAVLAVRGRSFALLDPADKERRLAGWGAMLAGAARLNGPIHRLQWIERTSPGAGDALHRYVRESASGEPSAVSARRSYEALIAGAGPATQEHETLLVVSIRPRRGGPGRMGDRSAGRRPTDGGFEILRREIRLLIGALRNAELSAAAPLSSDELATAIRAGTDSEARRRQLVSGRGGAWPMASDEAWSALRVDGVWHATFWIAEWPRLEVGPDFLAPLLLIGGHRSVALTMAPVPPDRASREAESARTAGLADDELRRRAGFLTTARHQREAEGVLRRESELADGHAEFRFSGYVTVTAADRSGLEAACAEVEQGAQAARLVLRRLYGQQAAAYTWTLPLGRGLS